MAKNIFLADNSIPGQSAAELHMRTVDSLVSFFSPARNNAYRDAFRHADRNSLRDLGLDRDAC